jgi:presenilin-like A22 family membrane protease
MKHNVKITTILLLMFIVAQVIGLIVISLYQGQTLPYGMQPPEMTTSASISSIIISIFLAVSLVFLLMKIKANWVMRIWFFSVVAIALAMTFNAFTQNILPHSAIIVLIAGAILSYIKIFKRDIIVHNLTELLIYPGIAAIFVPMLSILSVSILLVLISLYDIYAVWHSGIMQKMAKFQIQELKLFAGFFVPYMTKPLPKKTGKMKKVKVHLAILGGGDVVFPIMAAGVMLIAYGWLAALLVSAFAALGLLCLFIKAEKGEFYPAMPFISAGCFIGMALFAVLNSLL